MNYLDSAESLRNECKKATKERIPSLGEKLPKCIEELNLLLPLLESVSCCHWWCPGQEEPHVIQRLLGKGVSHTLAGLELAYSGHYDESMGLARTVGETTNLTWLFCLKGDELDKWQSLEGMQRWNKYRPAKVRKKITALNSPIPIDEDRYSTLSEDTAHVNPTSMPQAFNPAIPTLGGYLQEAGLMASINELSPAIAILGANSIRMLPNLPNQKRNEILNSSLRLLRSTGSVDLTRVVELRNGA
jgi:hypothetical protein